MRRLALVAFLLAALPLGLGCEDTSTEKVDTGDAAATGEDGEGDSPVVDRVTKDFTDGETGGSQATAPPMGDQTPAPKRPEGIAGSDVVREGPFELNAGGVTFAVPAGWRQVKLTDSQQRTGIIDARIIVPPTGTKATEPAEITVGVSGGGTERNVQMGRNQSPVATPAEEVAEVGGLAGTKVRYLGAAKPGEDLRGRRMIGVVVGVDASLDAADQRSKVLFLKFFGPAEVVEANAEAFDLMLQQADAEGNPSSAATAEPKEEQPKKAEPRKADEKKTEATKTGDGPKITID